jgi:hypothetical protein
MQKESINLHFYNLKYSKNSPFRHSKFGQHKTLVKFIFYYSMVFLMFQGFHRYKICNFWTYRTPDMIFARFYLFKILFKKQGGPRGVFLLAGTGSVFDLTEAIGST